MSLWPVIISLIILAVATVIFFLLPAIIDFEMSFLWVAGIFIVVYIGVAIYLGTHLSISPLKSSTDQIPDSPDVVVVQ